MISVNKRIGRASAAFVALALITSACGSDDASSSSTAAPATTTGTDATSAPVDTDAPTDTETEATTVATTDTVTGDTAVGAEDGVTSSGISEERCATNKAAGTITYISSFDYAAAASIVDVIVAKEKGYFDEMCLDVELQSGFSSSNYPLVAADQAQFSSAGSYTEILNHTLDGAEFLAFVDYGKEAVEALVTPKDGAATLADLKGKTIGVKGDIPPSLVAMLTKAGLVRGTDFDEVLLDGFDPVAHLATGIDALPVYKSNEPGQLDAAGVEYNEFDPAAEDIPGSFGLLYTSASYARNNPTVVEDFARASLKGMEDAIADPAAAVEFSVNLIDAAGNEAFLTVEGETFRWTQESEIVLASTPQGEPVGLIDADLLAAEYAAYVDGGVWPDGAPEDTKPYDDSIAKSLYGDDGKVIWPAG